MNDADRAVAAKRKANDQVEARLKAEQERVEGALRSAFRLELNAEIERTLDALRSKDYAGGQMMPVDERGFLFWHTSERAGWLVYSTSEHRYYLLSNGGFLKGWVSYSPVNVKKLDSGRLRTLIDGVKKLRAS